METWVLLSISAAFLQNLRSALQKILTPQVGVVGATYARFVFAAPCAVLCAALLIRLDDHPAPGFTLAFALWGLSGGLGQIAGTLLLLKLFSLRNFAVGNTFAKTETVQAAIIGFLLLGDLVAPLPMAGILLSLAGLVIVSGTRGFHGGALNRAAGLGIASGAAFAYSGVAYRAAGLSLAGEGEFLIRAAVTLAFVTAAQTAALSIWMALRAPGAMGRVMRAWRVAAPVGLTGMLASLCWFSAFTLATAANVKAVGQVELVFSYLTAVLLFRERPSLRETLGMTIVSGGILLLVLSS